MNLTIRGECFVAVILICAAIGLYSYITDQQTPAPPPIAASSTADTSSAVAYREELSSLKADIEKLSADIAQNTSESASTQK